MQERTQAMLPDAQWLEPVTSAQSGFRNKAKIVVAGSSQNPTLGILGDGSGQDLSECPLYLPAIRRAHEPLRNFITRLDLTPYSVPDRCGELKSIIVTASPSQLMVRFVLRSHQLVDRIRDGLPALASEIPLAVGTANILPEHVALVEGDEEIHLYGDTYLPMDLGFMTLHLQAGGFFQTNTDIARNLYGTASAWVDEVNPQTVWDLYCGVGGFATALARPGRSITAVEISQAAVDGMAEAPGVTKVVADVGHWVTTQSVTPDLLVVNPPRRGITDLADWLATRQIPYVLYSSCNLASAVTDMERAGYRAVLAQNFDMFPHTAHVETLMLLSRHS